MFMGLFSHCSRLTRELGPFCCGINFPMQPVGLFSMENKITGISEGNKKII